MPSVPVLELDFGRERLRAWELDQLLGLQVPRRDAEMLCVRREFSWHQAEELIAKGCPPELVFDLLT
jgi:hypothetical protein